jgi:hypothetical protein
MTAGHGIAGAGARPRWPGAALLLLPVALSWGLSRRQAPLLIDDAYITFRYAENLLRGHGLVFNPGERVLGTTAPLWAGVLAAAGAMGFKIPDAALFLGQVFTALACGLLSLILWRRVAAALAIMAGLLLAAHPDVIFFANSGMETGFYLALVLASLGAALEQRFMLSALLGAAGFLTRPDGALLLILGAVLALFQGRKPFLRFAATAAVMVLPWLIFATVYYGSPLPFSITAKRLAHATGLVQLAQGYAVHLLPAPPMYVLALLAIPSGALVLLRRLELWPFAAWVILYAAGLILSRIAPVFPWYVTPLLPPIMLFMALTLQNLLSARSSRWSQSGQRAAAGAAVVLLAALGVWLFSWRDYYFEGRRMQFARVKDYLEIGHWVATQARPGDKILVGELGAVGYALMDFEVLDSSGITSPEIYRIRREQREQGAGEGRDRDTVDWVKAVIARFQPDWIVTWYNFLFLEDLARDPKILAQYSRVFPPLPGKDQFFVLQRQEAR